MFVEGYLLTPASVDAEKHFQSVEGGVKPLLTCPISHPLARLGLPLSILRKNFIPNIAAQPMFNINYLNIRRLFLPFFCRINFKILRYE
jgi:hypothetical protein